MHPALRATSERHLGLFTTAGALLTGCGSSEIRALCCWHAPGSQLDARKAS